jgi:hypothetical protein
MKSLTVDFNSEGVNLHNWDWLDPNDTAGCEEANEYQHERTETKMAHKTSHHSVKRFLL